MFAAASGWKQREFWGLCGTDGRVPCDAGGERGSDTDI